MTSTDAVVDAMGVDGPNPDEATDEDGAHAFFMAIEDAFIRLRGRALLLSPADWKVAESWHRAGIPIALIEQTLEGVFVRRWQAGKEGIQSLRYARKAVEKAWAELQKLQAPGVSTATDEQPGLDVGERLAALVNALPSTLDTRAQWSERILALENLGEAETVEDRLAELDQALLDEAWDGLEAADRDGLASRLEGSLEPLRSRLPQAEIERAELRLRNRLLRATLGLPLLSLFAPHAVAGSGA